MADDHHGELIIIRKKGGGGAGHHGGAWKIAFADFMTAMMAFFLVLWIINASDKDTKTVIARYFNPVKLENPSRAKKGVHGETSASTEGKEDRLDKAPDKPTNPGANGSPPKAPEKTEKTRPATHEKTTPAEAREVSEAQLFAQPYQILDRIAGAQGDVAPGASAEKGDADPQRLNGALSIDSFRDPFKPIGPGSPDDPVAFDAASRDRQTQGLEPANEDEKGRGKPAPSAAAAPTPSPSPAPTPKGQSKAEGEAPKPAAAPAGGPAETGATAEGAKGEAARSVAAEAKGAADSKDAAQAKSAAESVKLEKELKAKVAASVRSGAAPEIEAKQTSEGLLISLTDKLDFSMFNVGSAEPRPELVRAMEAVAKVLKAHPGRIVVRGYTDARPYRNGAYDNWRLSSDRAEMAYYMLTRGGAPAARFVRVEGYADRALKDPAHPLAAVNRRLEILVEEPKP